MYEISESDIKRKIEFENPWWETGAIDKFIDDWTPRAYLDLFYKLLADSKVRRAVVLMGPRRVGKTIMIYHAIQRLMDKKVKPQNIIYISVDTPNYFGLSLEKLLEIAIGERLKRTSKGFYVFFDEIQYLKGWERHLKALVDQYHGIKFVASGSAAAALKLKSSESGAGRFTDFLLPPLTFYEFLKLTGKEKLASPKRNIKALNKEFINYINYGGYPEAMFSKDIQSDPGRFIRSDIIDKVLLRDLPSLYGITDVQELNRLFTVLAYNTANEVSLKELSTKSGVAKQTIKKYIEYLESAFLIKRLPRIDENGKRFKRAVTFKVHLTNPSMRCALFGPVYENSDFIGNLVETTIFSQFLHAPMINDLYYARWGKGEIDFVMMSQEKPFWCMEVKWSDNIVNHLDKIKGLISFARKFKAQYLHVTTRTTDTNKEIDKMKIRFMSSSIACYTLGKTSFDLKNINDYLEK